MKAIINGKRYDTRNAKLLGTADAGLSRSDFKQWHAGLWRSRAGHHFLAGEGGPMTAWARRVGDMWGGGEGIIPLTAEDARQWAEQHLSTDDFEAAFGDAIEDA